MLARVLIVAGSDSSGGAGIQADIKSVTALGGYAATAVTALTVQDTLTVYDVLPVPAAFVVHQMRVVLSDIGADCIKTGMLGSIEVVQAVAQECRARAGSTPLVVDPVMMAKGGHPLLEQDARSAVAEELVPLSALVTPNVPEASVLSGTPIHDLGDMRRACDVILALGAGAVLLKGGHLEGPVVIDVLRTADGSEHLFERPRIATRHTHGTGCTLASAVATGIAEGLTLFDAVRRARDYVQAAIVQAPGFGQGFGPLNHVHGINRPG